MCKKRIYRFCNQRLEQDIKSRCNPHFIWNAWKLKCSTVKVICTCDQCDSAFCALQPTALIKLHWCILLHYCACLHPNTILMEAGWATIPCPATKLSILICKPSARTTQNVITVALKTPLEIRLVNCIYVKHNFCIDPDDYIGFTPSCPPHILQQNCAHAYKQTVTANGIVAIAWIRRQTVNVYSFLSVGLTYRAMGKVVACRTIFILKLSH